MTIDRNADASGQMNRFHHCLKRAQTVLESWSINAEEFWRSAVAASGGSGARAWGLRMPDGVHCWRRSRESRAKRHVAEVRVDTCQGQGTGQLARARVATTRTERRSHKALTSKPEFVAARRVARGHAHTAAGPRPQGSRRRSSPCRRRGGNAWDDSASWEWN